MPLYDLSVLSWSDFEKLCGDLLEADGFEVEPLPVGAPGADFIAIRIYRDHQGHELRQPWLVQCKNYAGSKRSVRAGDIQGIGDFARANDCKGVIVVTSTSISRPAEDILKGSGEHEVWDARRLQVMLERHPDVAKRYGLATQATQSWPLGDAPANLKALVVSDGTPLSYSVSHALRSAGMLVTHIPPWHEAGQRTREVMLARSLRDEFDIALFFRGANFSQPLPPRLIATIIEHVSEKRPLILTPFAAWRARVGLDLELQPLLPVALSPARDAQAIVEASTAAYKDRLFPDYWDIEARVASVCDGFVENSYNEWHTTKEGTTALATDVAFGFYNSYELLTPKDSTEVWLRSTTGLPAVVVWDSLAPPVAYVNCCFHTCFSGTWMDDPWDAAPDFRDLFLRLIAVLLGPRTVESKQQDET